MDNNEIVFAISTKDVLACALEAGLTQAQVTDGLMALVKEKLARLNWHEAIKQTLSQNAHCPLGQTCFASCYWWHEAGCRFSPRRIKGGLVST